ncbi:addiction module protein [Azospirillum brasilense]|uniref:addiction module protein n=1 Tax=Azospirillum brasilense TaxID=192 RepID=UPI001B3B576F|nr:addiction module protein [Azospirillum brasilense]
MPIDFSHLSPQERLDLIGELWESLDEGDVPVSEGVRAELDRRNADFQEGRVKAVSWSELRGVLRPGRA